jgi:hypothetical protein
MNDETIPNPFPISTETELKARTGTELVFDFFSYYVTTFYDKTGTDKKNIPFFHSTG